MRIKQDYVSEQFHQMYFEISVEEMDNIFTEVYEENADLIDTHTEALMESIKEKIEYEVLMDEIDNLDVYMVGPKMVKYLTKIERGKMLLGIVQFCILPENLDLELPTYIPTKFLDIEITDEDIDKLVNKILLENNYYELSESEIVTKTAIVTYDLCYTKDDLLINQIKDQIFDMASDNNDIDPLKLEGKKKADKVILDEDEIVVEARITKIEEKIPSTLTEEIVKRLKFSRVITVEGFKRKIRETVRFGKLLDVIVYYITEFVIQNKQLSFDSYVNNFYLKYAEHCDLTTEKIDYNMGIQRMLIIEYLSAIIDIKYDGDRVEYANKVGDEQILAHLLDGSDLYFDDSFFERRIQEVKILNYCISEKIVDIKI